MDKSIWEKTIREDTNKKGMRSCNKNKERVCTEEGESVSIVKGRKREGEGVCLRAAKEGVYPII